MGPTGEEGRHLRVDRSTRLTYAGQVHPAIARCVGGQDAIRLVPGPGGQQVHRRERGAGRGPAAEGSVGRLGRMTGQRCAGARGGARLGDGALSKQVGGHAGRVEDAVHPQGTGSRWVGVGGHRWTCRRAFRHAGRRRPVTLARSGTRQPGPVHDRRQLGSVPGWVGVPSMMRGGGVVSWARRSLRHEIWVLAVGALIVTLTLCFFLPVPRTRLPLDV